MKGQPPQIIAIARRAMPLMTPEARAETETLIGVLQRTANAGEPTPASSAGTAFARDMQPVCTALVAALRSGDQAALAGLRALLPHLLAEVNRAPELSDVLALQLGKTFIEGLVRKEQP